MSDIEKLIEETKKRLTQLRERQRIERAAERKAVAKQKRADDTRRKVLFGVGILNAIENKRIDEATVLKLINDSIIRAEDREFLGLDQPTATASVDSGDGFEQQEQQ
jgi:hypothetical protein